jgi:cation diffusion facilitator CzcD-associated flavoprotein CzcO
MRSTAVYVAIIGAGPYGLSLAAHLCVGNLSYHIFGTPMSSWRNHMRTRTWLKSDGFASSLYDPDSAFTLARYCQEQSLPYADVDLPVPKLANRWDLPMLAVMSSISPWEGVC